MNKPAQMCSADVFRTLHKICARLTRKTPFALYLGVLHLPVSAADPSKHLLRTLNRGEVFCQMQPGLIYILLFAHSEEEAEQSLAPALNGLNGAALRLTCVRTDASDVPVSF